MSTATTHAERVAYAQQRLARIDAVRRATRYAADGRTPDQIAETMGVPGTTVHRLLKVAEGTDPEVESPEELILRAAVGGTDRATLVDRLTGYPYSWTVYAPEPYEGSIPGTWRQVEEAFFDGYLSETEYECIRARVRPPTP